VKLLTVLGAGPGDVISLVGGGGKTSLGLALVAEAVVAGLRAVFAVTTKIYPVPLPTVVGLDLAAVRRFSACCVVAGPAPGGKLAGLPPTEIGHLLEAANFVAVEADGSAGRPLKFPLAHEPVIPPASTFVLPVAGAGVVGKPLTDEWVHRAAQAAAYLGVPEGGGVTAAMVARLLWGPAAQGRPKAARVVPVINQVDNYPAAARAIGAELLALGARQVLLTAARAPGPVLEVMTARRRAGDPSPLPFSSPGLPFPSHGLHSPLSHCGMHKAPDDNRGR